MTQLMTRPPDTGQPAPTPPHPHYTLGTLVALGVVGTWSRSASG